MVAGGAGNRDRSDNALPSASHRIAASQATGSPHAARLASDFGHRPGITGIAEATIAALPAAEKTPTTGSLQLLCLLLTLNGGGDHK